MYSELIRILVNSSSYFIEDILEQKLTEFNKKLTARTRDAIEHRMIKKKKLKNLGMHITNGVIKKYRENTSSSYQSCCSS